MWRLINIRHGALPDFPTAPRQAWLGRRGARDSNRARARMRAGYWIMHRGLAWAAVFF